MNVLGICGSLRKGSYNAMALRAAQKLAPQGMRIDIADIARIPLYNDDVRAAGEPAEVAALKAQIRAADAVLLVTRNFSIQGVLKNTLDWMSRPPEPPFDGKVGRSRHQRTGEHGAGAGTTCAGAGVHEQLHRQQAGMFISQCGKFNADGELTDETRPSVTCWCHSRPEEGRPDGPLITDWQFYAAAIPAVLLLGISKSGFGAGFGSLAVPSWPRW
jgi:chromate reductase